MNSLQKPSPHVETVIVGTKLSKVSATIIAGGLLPILYPQARIPR
jgi:hypothetical protein